MEKFSIENLHTDKIPDKIINQIYELEVNAWARKDGLGEFVECPNCEQIYSKEDIFGDLPEYIRFETTIEIMKVLNIQEVSCPCCNARTKPIFGQSYKEEIRQRYEKDKAYLSVAYDNNKKIIGYMDGYIDNFAAYYEKELSGYYEEDIIVIQKKVEAILKKDLPNELLSFAGFGVHEKHKSFFIVYSLLKNFFETLSQESIEAVGITELRIGSLMHAVYSAIGVDQVDISNDTNRHKDNHSGIFLKNNIVKSYSNIFAQPVRGFVKRYNKKMHSVLLAS